MKIYIIFKKFWRILSVREKMISIILLSMMLISSVLELLGIGLIMPIIAMLADPNLLQQNKYLKLVYDLIQPGSQNRFMIILCVVIICLYIGKNAFLAFQNYAQNRFIMNKGAKLANQLFSNYIHAPYAYHLTHNSGHLMGKVSMADTLTNGILVPFMLLASESIVVLAIFMMLIFLSPVVTLLLGVVALALVSLIYFPLKGVNYNLGKVSQEEHIEMQKYALQGLQAIKESKVRNAEDFFSSEYAKHRWVSNQVAATMQTLGNLPRFIIEALIVSLGMGSILFLMLTGKPIGSIILTLSLFAISAVRIMPSMTRIQYNLTRMKQFTHSFNVLFEDIGDFEIEEKKIALESLEFKENITIDHLSFSYENSHEKVINDFSLSIKKNSSVAFIGPTGCGKTTLVDLILGLLQPNSGSVQVDDINITTNLVSWQKRIGYVPQFIYLLDDTVRANVAFGELIDDIDDKRVVHCLKMAQIYDFVDLLEDGINHIVGENGIQLSGGQRQRIGIARALYHDPEIIILDEATSALDHETEKAFIDALSNLKGKLTIIMIAHRLTTVENCDNIVKLK